MMALAPKIGRLNAHHVVEAACQQAVATQRHLQDVVAEIPQVQAHFNAAALEQIFKAESYLGNIQEQIDAVLTTAKGVNK